MGNKELIINQSLGGKGRGAQKEKQQSETASSAADLLLIPVSNNGFWQAYLLLNKATMTLF